MRWSSVVVLLALAGCAALKNTPIQDYVWEMGRRCEGRVADWRMERVETSGRYWLRATNATSADPFYACMQEQYRRTPFDAWLKDRKPSDVASVPSERATPLPVVAPGATLTTWKAGFEWVYRHQSGSNSSIFVWTVDREEVLDGEACYVVTSGSREIFVRKQDLAFYVERVAGTIETRRTPPTRYLSGTPGEKWEVRSVFENVARQTKTDMARLCEASGPQSLTVPTGTYETIKTTCTDARTGETVYEAWYAPAVRQLIRQKSRPGNIEDERELIGMRVW